MVSKLILLLTVEATGRTVILSQIQTPVILIYFSDISSFLLLMMYFRWTSLGDVNFEKVFRILHSSLVCLTLSRDSFQVYISLEDGFASP